MRHSSSPPPGWKQGQTGAGLKQGWHSFFKKLKISPPDHEENFMSLKRRHCISLQNGLIVLSP
jgi:hypothetical protein